MDWKNSRRSDNIEDLRGFSGTTAGGSWFTTRDTWARGVLQAMRGWQERAAGQARMREACERYEQQLQSHRGLASR